MRLKVIILPLTALIVISAGIGGFFYQQKQKDNINQKWINAEKSFKASDMQSANTQLKGLKLPNGQLKNDNSTKSEISQQDNNEDSPKPPSDKRKVEIYAQVKQAVGELDESQKAYEKLYIATKDPSFGIMLANIYSQKANKASDPQAKKDLNIKAIEIYTQITNDNSGYTQAYTNLAAAHALLGNSEEAIKTAEKGVANNPNNIQMHELLTGMLSSYKPDSKEFQQSFNDLKKLDPNNAYIASLENAQKVENE